MAGFVSKKHSKRKSKTKKRTINPGNAEGTGQAPTNTTTRRLNSPSKRFVVAARAENSKTRKSKSSSKKAAEAGNRVRNRTNSLPLLNMTRKNLNLRRNSLPINFKQNVVKPVSSVKKNVVDSAPLLTKCSFRPNTDSTMKGLVGTFKMVVVDKANMNGGTNSEKAGPNYYDLKIDIDDGKLKQPPKQTWSRLIHHIASNKDVFIERLTKRMQKTQDIGTIKSNEFVYVSHPNQNGFFINVYRKDEYENVIAHVTEFFENGPGHTFEPKKNTGRHGVSHSKSNGYTDVAVVSWWLSATTDCILNSTVKNYKFHLNFDVQNINDVIDKNDMYTYLHRLSLNVSVLIQRIFVNNDIRSTDTTLRQEIITILSKMCRNYQYDMDFKTRKGLRSDLFNRQGGIVNEDKYNIRYNYIREEEEKKINSTKGKIKVDSEPFKYLTLTDDISNEDTKRKLKQEEIDAVRRQTEEEIRKKQDKEEKIKNDRDEKQQLKDKQEAIKEAKQEEKKREEQKKNERIQQEEIERRKQEEIVRQEKQRTADNKQKFTQKRGKKRTGSNGKT